MCSLQLRYVHCNGKEILFDSFHNNVHYGRQNLLIFLSSKGIQMDLWLGIRNRFTKFFMTIWHKCHVQEFKVGEI